MNQTRVYTQYNTLKCKCSHERCLTAYKSREMFNYEIMINLILLKMASDSNCCHVYARTDRKIISNQ